MVLFWCRTRQVQLRAISNQLKRCYFQIHQPLTVIRGTNIGVVNGPSLTFHRTGSEFGNRVRFFAAPAQVKAKYEGKDKDKDKGRPRMNKQINEPYVRLVTDEGHDVVERDVALARATELELDLVEVQSGNPPVCKLMDYNKEMYKKHILEKERTKKKADVSLRKGGLKEVRITHKIDKHDMQTKADTVKRLAERGYRVKCMAVIVPNEDTKKQNLAGLLSRLAALIDDFSIVESGPKIEAKQAYIVVRHSKFGPLKKGTGKKNVLEILNSSISKQSLEEEQSLNEADSDTVEDTDSETETELDSTDDFDQNQRVKAAPEVTNRYAATKQTNNGSENRYATTRPTNGPGVRRQFEPESQSQHQSQNPNNRRGDFSRRGPGESASGYGMFDPPKPNNDSQRDSRPVEVNRYQKGPRPQVPTSRGDYSRENTNMNPGGVRDKQAGFRR
ncbi:putative translation initiation factor 3 [Helianthus annuus]|nr:putative translation initiation factor 3 [Helianthus annuus]